MPSRSRKIHRAPDSRRETPTLRDVASAAGVDVSTVSKVLSGASISVRPETRTRIEEVARELRYRPNASARSLRLSRTGALGMLVPDFTNPVYAAIVRGAVRRAEALDLVMLIAELDKDHSPAAYLRLVRERRIDGLLIATARDESPLQRELDRDAVPHVFVNRRGAAASLSVVVDDEAGAALGTQALVDAGHRRLGLIGGPEDVDTARRRRAGFEAVQEAHDLPTPRIVSAPYSARGGYDAMRQMLAGRWRPTGVLVATLTMTLGALSALAEAGLSVPGDMSVVAYDDAELAAVAQPPLTSVRMPHDEMGAMGIDLLEEVLGGGKAESRVVPTAPVLVERASVAPPKRRRAAS